MLKNKWRFNLKARNSYKNLLTTIEKIIEIRCFKSRRWVWTILKVNSVQGDSSAPESDNLQQVKQQILNKEKEIELSHAKTTSNSLVSIKDSLLNNNDVFNRIFVDENLFASLNEEEFFNRLSTVFKQGELTKECLQKRGDVDDVINAVTEKQEIKHLINNQLEKTKVLKGKLDDIKDELFSDYHQDEEETNYPEIINFFTTQQKD